MSLFKRDLQLRQALEWSLSHTMDGTAMCAIFGALGSMVETDQHAESLELAQRGILSLLGGFPPGSTLTVSSQPIQTVDNDVAGAPLSSVDGPAPNDLSEAP
jgi:hypothetical protein